MTKQIRLFHRAALMLLAVSILQLASRPSVCIAQDGKPRGEQPAKVDFFGDPLPAGALARIGTARLRGQVLTFTDEGKTLVTLGADRALHFWDVANGQERRCHQLHAALQEKYGKLVFRARRLSPDEKKLVAADNETIRVWEVATGKELGKIANPAFKANRISLERVAVSNDGQLIAGVVEDLNVQKHLVRLWNLANGKEHTLSFDKTEGAFPAFSPDNKTLVVAGRKGAIRLIDTASAKETRQIKLEELPLFFVRASAEKMELNRYPDCPVVSPDGKSLAWLGGPHAVKLWNMSDGSEKASWPIADFGKQFSWQFSPDGKRLAFSSDKGVLVWDVATRKQVQKIPAPEGGVFEHVQKGQVAFSPDGRTLAISRPDGAHLHDIVTGKLHMQPHGLAGDIDRIVYAPDGKSLATASSRDVFIRVWETATGKPLASMKCPEHTMSAIFTADGKHLLAGDRKGIIYVWNAITGDLVRKLELNEEKSEKFYYAVTRLACHGQTVTAFGLRSDRRNEKEPQQKNWHLVWDWEKDKVSKRVEIPFQFNSVLSPDGTPFYVEQRIELLNSLTGKTVAKLDEPDFVGNRFTADGKKLAVRSFEGVKLLDLPTGREFAKPITGKYDEFEISLDGRIVAIANRVEVSLWEVASGKRVFRIPAPVLYSIAENDAFCTRMQLSREGRTIALAFRDTTILIYDIAPGLVRDPKPLKALDRKDLEKLWSDLASDDAAEAYRAVWSLASCPDQAVPFLKERLKPAGDNSKQISELIADLGSATFATREAAFKKLQFYVEIEPALRRAMANGATLEFSRRVELLLAVPAGIVRDREDLRGVRAIWALEASDSAAARELLTILAGGGNESRLTQAAKNCLERQK